MTKRRQKKLLIIAGSALGVAAIIAGIWFYLARVDDILRQGDPIVKKAIRFSVANPIVEKAIRKRSGKLTGELTNKDRDEVTYLGLGRNQLTEVPNELEKLWRLKVLHLNNNQLTNVKGLEKLTNLWVLSLKNNQLINAAGLENLTQLKELYIDNNPALTKAQIDELQKALPKCIISHDFN